MMKIVVTGGAGFIGSHVVEALLNLGSSVVVIDNLRSGSLANLPLDHPYLEVVQGDILEVCASAQFPQADAIVHLAAIPSVQESLSEPFETHKINYESTLALVETARKLRIQRFIFASSAAVYGISKQLPLSEDSSTVPISHYGADKLASETILRIYQDLYGLESCSLRFFNVYGPRQNPNSPYSGAISRFAECVSQGRPISIYGDGQQTRDFIYVGDVANVICSAALSTEAPPPVLNVSTGRATSLNDVIRALEPIAPRPIEIHFLDRRSGDIRHSIGDCTKLGEWMAQWNPLEIQEGLLRFANSLA